MAGGSIESVTIAGRTFGVAFDADVNRKLGGFENEFQSNGDGTSRQIKSRVPWMLDGVQISVDDINGDHEFLQNIADASGDVPITITYVDGSIYQGAGSIAGEMQFSNQSQTATLQLSGPGKLTKQV
jgi:hypothetical protein